MEPESFAIEQLKNKLMELGYRNSAIKTNVKTPYGKGIDLVIYEFNKPKIVFEVKIGLEFPAFYETDEFRFNPAVRQSQSLSQDLSAPYFAVSDGNTIYWFEIDKGVGRPKLLRNPVLPSQQNQDLENLQDEKGNVLSILFTLNDLGRDYYSNQKSLTYVGLALYARLYAETNNQDFENLIINQSAQKQLMDTAFSGFNINLDEKIQGFYATAFSFLTSFDLLKIDSGNFIDALDEFVSINLNQNNRGIFKLPSWLSELLTNLGQIKNSDQVLDIYSNYGDGIASVAREVKQAKVYSITPTTESFIWDKLKRLVLGLNSQDVIQIEDPLKYGIQSYRFTGKLDKIFVCPPFGQRVKSEMGFSQKSEDLFLEVALNWVLPGGRVIALVPENLLFSLNREDIRQKLSEGAWIRAIISLEQFMPGTSIKASIIVLEKKSPTNFGARIMMSKILDRDIPDYYRTRRSIRSSDEIQRLLHFYNALIENKVLSELHPV